MKHPPAPSDITEVPDATRPGPSGLARLFEQHNSMLIHLLRAKLHSEQEARDVAQEAYVRMLQLDRLGAVSYLRAYLFRTALNIANDRLRMDRVRREAHRDPSFLDRIEENSPEGAVAAIDELAVVRRALEGLPPKMREAFALHGFAELDLKEVAARMGVTERSVRNYVADALVCCREAIDGVRSQANKPMSKKPGRGEGLL